jgi:ketosteroid isomerase-like protein
VPFESFAELSCVMTNPAIKVHGTIARVAGLERVRGLMKNGESFAFTALGTNVYEKRGDRWLIVHHHASKAAAHLTN